MSDLCLFVYPDISAQSNQSFAAEISSCSVPDTRSPIPSTWEPLSPTLTPVLLPALLHSPHRVPSKSKAQRRPLIPGDISCLPPLGAVGAQTNQWQSSRLRGPARSHPSLSFTKTCQSANGKGYDVKQPICRFLTLFTNCCGE